MASSPVTQAALYIDGTPRVTQTADLFTVEYDGLTLKLTPYAMMGLVLKSRRAFADWNALNNARAKGVVVDPTAQIIAFPKACPVIRVKGEAC